MKELRMCEFCGTIRKGRIGFSEHCPQCGGDVYVSVTPTETETSRPHDFAEKLDKHPIVEFPKLLAEEMNKENSELVKDNFRERPWESVDKLYEEGLRLETSEYIPEGINALYDPVLYPKGYNRGKIEVWDFICDQRLDYIAGNVIKYICRYKDKNGLEDLKKAKAYIEKLIEETKKDEQVEQ